MTWDECCMLRHMHSRADAATLGSLSKALTSKLGSGEAPQDLLAALWGFATLDAKPDAALLTKAAAVLRSAVGTLNSEQQINAAWAMALLGQVSRLLICFVLPQLSYVCYPVDTYVVDIDNPHPLVHTYTHSPVLL